MRRRPARTLFALGLVFAAALGSAQDKPQAIETLLNGYRDVGGFNGAVLVAENGRVIFKKGFGFADFEWRIPNGADTKFRLGSITKQFTATLVMQLVEDGVLGLNRPAKDYLPEMSGPGTEEILVHHLLTHTSGYPFHTELPWTEHGRKKIGDGFTPSPCPPGQHPLVHQLLSIFWDLPPVARVGELMVYSSYNYELLGEIVRRLGGRSLEEQARERIFDPLGMNDSWYEVPETESHRVVQRAPGLPLADFENPFMQGMGSRQMQETPYGGAGLFTTPLDVAVFAQTFLNDGCYGDARILSPAAVAAMTRDQIPGLRAVIVGKESARASCGYGFLVVSPTKWKYFEGSLVPLGTFGHPGAAGQMFWVDPEHELVGSYFEVTTRVTPEYEFLWNFDLFQNAITAAVDD